MEFINNMRKQKVTIISLLLVFLLIQTTSALLGTYEKDTSVDLIQTCNNCTYCNLTSIKYPNGTDILRNVKMTKNLTYFNFLLDGGNITTVGTYTYYYDCGNGFETATGGINFEVTNTGDETPEGVSYILAGIFIIIFGIGWFFLFLSIQMQEPGAKIFFLLASFIFLLGSLLMAMVVGLDSNLTEGVNTTIKVMMYAFGLIFFVVFAYIMIQQTISAMNLYRENKGYEIGW